MDCNPTVAFPEEAHSTVAMVPAFFDVVPALLQFALLGSQWGDAMKPPYPMFRTEAYWGASPNSCSDNSRH